jgi:hypothetical protein
MTTDISETLAPKSDQLDAVDLLGNPPQVFTVTKVDVKPNTEQPVSIHLAEFPRVWRPGLSMRRVLAYCWGKESAAWTDRKVELYCDERIRFGNDVVGGVRISRLSHIDGEKSIPLIVSRGKSAAFKVKPLPEPTNADRIASLRAEFRNADETRKAAILDEVKALQGAGE